MELPKAYHQNHLITSSIQNVSIEIMRSQRILDSVLWMHRWYNVIRKNMENDLIVAKTVWENALPTLIIILYRFSVWHRMAEVFAMCYGYPVHSYTTKLSKAPPYEVVIIISCSGFLGLYNPKIHLAKRYI